jgi:hypothetical protein
VALKTRFVRDRQNRVCGTVTIGYPDGIETVRNRRGLLIGRVLPSQKLTKDSHNRIVAHNADPGFASKNDVMGKVFLYISPNERRCLLCLRVFSQLDSLQHAGERVILSLH